MSSSDSPLEYLKGAVKISAGVLQTLGGAIPIPYVATAIDAACKVIEIAEAVKANVIAAAGLIDRVYAITLVVATSLQGKAIKDIPKDLKASIERLASDLSAISRDLERIRKRLNTRLLSSQIKAILGYGDNTALIADCESRLDWALRSFDVQTHIQDSIRIAQTSQDVKKVQAGVDALQKGQQDIGTNVEAVRSTLENVALALQKPEVATPSSHLPSSIIPPKPEIFFGRGSVVAGISSRLASTPAARFGLLGPGGIGKTSVASAVAENNAVVEHFSDRRYWVNCELATTVTALLEAIARGLGLKLGSMDPLQDIKYCLASNTLPSVIFLDNFETPWDIKGRQSEVLDVLSTLSGNPHVSIIVTMRGTLPGVGRIKWTKPELLPLHVLSKDAAIQLYTEIDPKATGSPDLDELLAELGYLPLAITLMASVGLDGESPKELLAQWRKDGVRVADQPGGDRRTSLERSIEASLKSNAMTSEPLALELLSVIAFLPSGLKASIMKELFSNKAGLSRARSALLRTSLAYTTPDGESLNLLPTIRSYLQLRYGLTTETWNMMLDFYIRYILEDVDSDREGPYPNLQNETLNIEAVLLHALEDEPSERVTQTAVSYANYQCLYQPRLGIVTAVVEVLRREENPEELAMALRMCGETLKTLSRYDEAIPMLKECRETCLALQDPVFRSLAAICLYHLAAMDLARSHLEDARAAGIQGASESEGADMKAECLLLVATVDCAQGKPSEARSLILKVQKDLSQSDDNSTKQLLNADCLVALAQVDGIQGRYDAAFESFTSARRIYEEYGVLTTVPQILCLLADIATLQHRYETAESLCNQAISMEIDRGSALGVTLCQVQLGVIFQQLGRLEDAQKILLDVEVKLGGKQKLDRSGECRRALGDTYCAQGRYEEAREVLNSVYEYCVRVNTPYGIAMSLESISKVVVKVSLYDQGRAQLREALEIWEMLEDEPQIAACKRSLAEIDKPEASNELGDIARRDAFAIRWPWPSHSGIESS